MCYFDCNLMHCLLMLFSLFLANLICHWVRRNMYIFYKYIWLFKMINRLQSTTVGKLGLRFFCKLSSTLRTEDDGRFVIPPSQIITFPRAHGDECARQST